MQWQRRVQIALGNSCNSKVNVGPAVQQCEALDPGLFYSGDAGRESFVAIIERQYCGTITRTISAADEICEHVFDLLGSGKVRFGTKIDWERDFKTGYTWDRKFYADIIQVPGDSSADVKVPRELSRCHHFITLGKAYRYTNDEKYAGEFINQLKSWIDSNPPWMTVNWCSAMDVAIRLVNWIWAYHFFYDSPQFDVQTRKLFLRSLVLHAEFVADNLEYYGELSDNHYVANLTGLAFVGILFPELKGATKWKRVGLKGLFGEVISQVHDDGVHFEGSTGYHRLVLEMFVSVLILCLKNGIEIPAKVWRRVEKMFEFVLHYTKPDGTAPQIGDADNARLQVLSQNEIMDHRYLLATGAVLFNRPEFKAAAGTFHEEAFWLLGEQGLNKFDTTVSHPVPPSSKAFPEGGFYFLRNRQLYMAVRCAPNGRRGLGNHSHNDALSFELYAYDKTFIVDPGTYLYTSAPTWRNLFRSTAYHNTLVVDGQEISRIPDNLFRLMNDVSPVVHRWETTDRADILDAQHNGYERLSLPVTHRRQFYFDKLDNYWVIRDLIAGTGKHELSWYFHFDAGIPIRTENGRTIETFCQEGANLLLHAVDLPPARVAIDEGWVSPSYGIKKKAQIARFSCTIELPISTVFILYPYVGKGGSLPIPGSIVARATSCWEALS